MDCIAMAHGWARHCAPVAVTQCVGVKQQLNISFLFPLF